MLLMLFVAGLADDDAKGVNGSAVRSYLFRTKCARLAKY
jgi:hypothetical protein